MAEKFSRGNQKGIYEDGTVSYTSKPIYSLDRLTPERPLVVRMTFPGDTLLLRETN